ncbi:helix-turn-helix transcriptional regulator [uncultured Roseibium sp.]|uniref:helix-turn-helix domain-containing protein n=1 Tax=uncultured Roseibium sp. TaxID=1936171 RepID=UPI00321733FB
MVARLHGIKALRIRTINPFNSYQARRFPRMPQTMKSIIRVLKLDTRLVLNTAGLPADFLSDETRRVKIEELNAFDRAVEQVNGRVDISYALAMFRAHTSRPSSTLAFAKCNTLLAGFERLIELRGPSGGMVHSIDVLDDRFRIEIRPLSPERVVLQWASLCEILYFVELGRTYTGDHIAPVRAGIMAPDRLRAEDLAYLGVKPVVSRHPFVEFKRDDGTRPLLTAPHWPRSAGKRPGAGKDSFARQEPIVDRVESTLAAILPSGKYGIVDVCEHLDMNERKLQRLLKAESTSFRAILDETRKRMAIRYLEEERRPVAEVAALLGYQNQNSFYRAFKGWTGTTTTVFRKVP